MNKSYPSVGVISQIGIIVDLGESAAALWHSLPWGGVAFLVSGIVAFTEVLYNCSLSNQIVTGPSFTRLPVWCVWTGN